MVKIDVSAELALPAAQMFVERDYPGFQALLAKALNLAIMEVRDTWPLPEGGGSVVQLMTKPNIEQYVPKVVLQRLTPLQQPSHTTELETLCQHGHDVP